MQEQFRAGIQYLEAATVLLQRVGRTHPTAGLLEAADLHWWWRAPRPSDSLPQLFWFDAAGHPMAAVIATDWGDGVALDPIVMPDAPAGWVEHILERALAHARARGLEDVDIVVDRADHAMHDVLARHGFAIAHDERLDVVLSMRDAKDRPPVGTLEQGYRLARRVDTRQWPHHLIPRSGPGIEERLRQTSLYRPDLDLLVLDGKENVAAYGLFWLDPVTLTGLVEPMRTEDAHQQRGLARHVLAAGMGLLAQAGAERIKVCFKPSNAAARALYLGAGFKPYKQTAVFSRKGV